MTHQTDNIKEERNQLTTWYENEVSPKASTLEVNASPRVNERKRPYETKQSPIGKQYFQSKLELVSERNYRDLEEMFHQYEGKLPSRKEIRILSAKSDISQSKIRKWFLDHHEQQTECIDGIGRPGGGAAKGEGRKSFDERLRQLEEKVSKIEDQMDVMGVQLAFVTQTIDYIPLILSKINNL